MTNEKERKPIHTLTDHAFGEGLLKGHEHGPDADHDHDDFESGALEDNALWIQDNVWLTSVGIDIGSAGTQILFSRLHLQRLGEELSSRYAVVSRSVLYQSPVALTPYRNEELIDAEKLGSLIDAAYQDANLLPADVDTGVVILTGEALRRDNAEAIAAIVAETAGEFVCATAGHHMEAMLAGYGSGAARVSYETGKRILNIDIGGGTTKLAIVENGCVTATAAVHIGGRLLVVNTEGQIVRLDPAGQRLASEAGMKWTLGAFASLEDMTCVADWMAGAIIDVLAKRPLPNSVERLYLTDPLLDLDRIDGIMASGGVAEFVYGRETRDFGDLGHLLGQSLKRRLDAGDLPWPLLPAGECIRATALGAAEYSVQISGNTTFISNPQNLLPQHNLQVLQPVFDGLGDIDPECVAEAIWSHLKKFDLSPAQRDFALAFRWRGAPSYARLSAFAAGIVAGLQASLEAGRPIYLVLDGDVAQVLGKLLRDEFAVKNDILVIDGIVLWDFDYIDIGRIRMPSYTVPVTVKSLVFHDHPLEYRFKAGGVHPHGHDHHHDDGSSGGIHSHHHDHLSDSDAQ